MVDPLFLGADKHDYMTKIRLSLLSLPYTMGYMSYTCAHIYLSHVRTKPILGTTGTGVSGMLESKDFSTSTARTWLMGLLWYHLHLSIVQCALRQNNLKHPFP